MITSNRLRFGIGVVVATMAVGYQAVAMLSADEPMVAAGKKALEPPAPLPPAEAIDAIEEGRFDVAAQTLARRIEDEKDPDTRSFLALLEANARRLAGRRDEARAVLKRALGQNPHGRFHAKLAGALSDLETKEGNPQGSLALLQEITGELLSGARKDALASVYHDIAIRLLEPKDPLQKPDPEAAHALLEQAHALAVSPAERARLLLVMARASAAAGNETRSIADLNRYLADHPGDPRRFAARLALGQSLRRGGQAVAARATLSDLAAELATTKALARPAADAIRADALHEIALSHGVPDPPDDSSRSRGIQALKQFLAAYPGHPRAVTAAYQIAATHKAGEETEETLAALERFLKKQDFRLETDAARREFAALSMTASFEIGGVLKELGRYELAIAAWKRYLVEFPNGPQGTDAQRAILDARLQIADDLEQSGQQAKARAAWRQFVADNPLDSRAPEALFQIGESLSDEKQVAQAVAAWDELIQRFPESEKAANAQFEAALLVNQAQGDPVGAIERLKKITLEPWRTQARDEIQMMEAKHLAVVTPRVFRGGESPKLKIATRNLESLTFSTYRLDAEAYFRKKTTLSGVEALDIGLVAPDATWTVPVPGYARYKPVDVEYELKPLESPGVHVVRVSDEKSLQATTLVIASDLDAVIKASRDQVLVYAQDMKTGRGRPGTRVLVAQNGQVIVDGTTGADGVLIKDWDHAKDPNTPLSCLVLDGRHAAGTALAIPGTVAIGLTPRAYLDTDRPVYRPGQTVRIRGVVREVDQGQYAVHAGAAYDFKVADSQGRVVAARDVSLSEFGTFQEQLSLDPSAPLGEYQIHLVQPGKSDFHGKFTVQAYELLPFDLEFKLDRTVYYRGETIKGAVAARYQHGAPASRPVVVTLPDGRILRGSTDQAGLFAFELPTTDFLEDQALTIAARLPEDGVDAQAQLRVAVLGFGIQVSLPRQVYVSGETALATLETTDAQGKPIGVELELRLEKQAERGRVIQGPRVKTNPTTGKTTASIRLDDREGGSYLLHAQGVDQFGNVIHANEQVVISGSESEDELLLLADRQTWKVGEKAKVNLNSRARAGTALITWDADRILSYKLVELHAGDNRLEWDVIPSQAPNLSLTATRMWRDKLDQASLDLAIERDLKLTVTPTRSTVGPGESIEIAITTTDQIGRPVSAELSLGMVDQAIWRLGVEPRPAIDTFFYDQNRSGCFAIRSTNTFRYEPPTTAVARSVVEEQEKAAADKADADDRKRLDGRFGAILGKQVELAQAPARPGGANRLMGGMGGMGRAPVIVGTQGAEMKGGRDRGEGLEPGARGGEAPPRPMRTETAYWNPRVVTGKDGKAKVVFKAPLSMARYRVLARGVTGSDTLAGQDETSIVVGKSFFLDLRAPMIVNQGDRPRFLARLYHGDARGKAELRLTIRSGERESVFPMVVDLGPSGLAEVLFDPYEVPSSGSLTLLLTAQLGEQHDAVTTLAQVRPWGVHAVASAAGSSQGDETLLLELPPGREYSQPSMRIVISPMKSNLIAEIALGSGRLGREPMSAPAFPCPTNLDRASDLLASAQAIEYLRQIKAGLAPEGNRLVDRARSLASGLVAAQNDDGGWSWAIRSPSPYRGKASPPGPGTSDRRSTAIAVWALASAQPLGLVSDPRSLERGLAYLKQDYARLGTSDHESRALVLHALSTRKQAAFEEANRLNRARASLSSASLARLALVFASLDRPALADEALAILVSRAKREPVAPGRPDRIHWSDAAIQAPSLSIETTAISALALTKARPTAPELAPAIAWLESNRQGLGYRPRAAVGPTVAALAAYHGKAREALTNYHLTITVNEVKVAALDVAVAGSSREFTPPPAVLRLDRPNTIGLAIEGRGRYDYAATLSGFTRSIEPERNRAGQEVVVERRVYSPAPSELDGHRLATGFATILDPKPFENIATQVALGGSTRVLLTANRPSFNNQPMNMNDGVIVQDYLPAGASLVEGSVVSSADYVGLDDGVLTLAFGPQRDPGLITYELTGVIPGEYRVPPPRARTAEDPGVGHLGEPGRLTIHPRGEPGTDPYKPTPDELFARGKAQFQARRFALATAALEPYTEQFTPRDEFLSEAARMLLLANLELKKPREIVRDFELVKEKAPDLVLNYDQLRAIASGYQEINEYERAMIMWRGMIEASFLEDARVGELLRQRGRPLEAIGHLIELWRAYPESPALESDFLGLSQVVIETASRAATDPSVRQKLALAGVTRPELLLQGARMIRLFLAMAPTNPLADEAELSLLGVVSDEGDDQAVLALAERFARNRPKSRFIDGFQYARALAAFKLGRHDQAIAAAESISKAVYKSPAGLDEPSPNKWQAIYILGQIHDARHEPARALGYYRQVADRYRDAASAVVSLSRKELSIPEITLARRSGTPVGASPAVAPKGPPNRVVVSYRNLAKLELKVYPVDLMRLYLSRRDLSGIAAIDLAGIAPLVQKEIPLGEPSCELGTRAIELPLEREGAYLVIMKGESLYASGVVLVSPLELETLEDPQAGSVRVTVRDSATRAFLPHVQVRIKGNGNGEFISGETDLRGVFLAEGVVGLATAVAREGTSRYALYRGTAFLGAQPIPPTSATTGGAAGQARRLDADQSLEGNLRSMNQMNNSSRIQRLEDRFKQLPADAAKGAPAGGFR